MSTTITHTSKISFATRVLSAALTGGNKKFELMLTRRVRA